MNEKVLLFSVIIFVASIFSNGLILMLSEAPNSDVIQLDTTYYDSSIDYSTLKSNSISVSDGFVSNTSQSQDASSFNPSKILDDAGNQVLAGVFSINLLLKALFYIEIVLINLAGIFLLFSPVFYAVSAVMVGMKLLLIGYAGSVLLKAILGGR